MHYGVSLCFATSRANTEACHRWVEVAGRWLLHPLVRVWFSHAHLWPPTRHRNKHICILTHSISRQHWVTMHAPSRGTQVAGTHAIGYTHPWPWASFGLVVNVNANNCCGLLAPETPALVKGEREVPPTPRLSPRWRHTGACTVYVSTLHVARSAAGTHRVCQAFSASQSTISRSSFSISPSRP